MVHRLCSVVTALLLAQICWGMTLVVRNAGDSGKETLRWAIGRANTNEGPDVITFSNAFRIRPASPLPPLSDPGTTIDGDLNDNGSPDVTLDGAGLTEGHGLEIRFVRGSASGPSIKPLPRLTLPTGSSAKIGCTVRGLAIFGFPGSGIAVLGRHANTIAACHFGVDGIQNQRWKAVPNGSNDLFMSGANYSTIGGPSAKDGNLFCCLSGDRGGAGVSMENCTGNRLYGNVFGLGSPDASSIPAVSRGIMVSRGEKNKIGGPDGGQGNSFEGVATGVRISASSNNVVAGNVFGLRSGRAHTPIVNAGVVLAGGAHDNTIGGTAPGARNAFAGNAEAGVVCEGAGTEANEILGNYFGLLPDGSNFAALQNGVMVLTSAGRQRIGMHTAGARNYFCGQGTGVLLVAAGAGSVIENNRFNAGPTAAVSANRLIPVAVSISFVSAHVVANEINLATCGVEVLQRGGAAQAHRNTFHNCQTGVRIGEGATAVLGNIGNGLPGDDGGNVFDRNTRWFITNQSASDIMAEGNDFGTTAAAVIDARISDKKDNPTRGMVDYDPLSGGVHPE